MPFSILCNCVGDEWCDFDFLMFLSFLVGLFSLIDLSFDSFLDGEGLSKGSDSFMGILII